jgi:hypothetical protein
MEQFSVSRLLQFQITLMEGLDSWTKKFIKNLAQIMNNFSKSLTKRIFL